MKFVIVHYNTPELTVALLASLLKNDIYKDIIVFENSDKRPLNALDMFDYELIDNQKSQIIDFNKEIEKLNQQNKMTPLMIRDEMNGVKYGSVKHALTVQWLIENLNEDFVLLDSDILIKADFRPLIDNTKLFVGDATEYRVLPFLLYLNAPLLQKNNIRFFDGENIHPFKKWFPNDTGGSFFRECKNSGLPFSIIKLDNYYIHYGSGSWRDFFTRDKSWYQGNYANITPMEFLSFNKHLFM